MKRRRPRLDRGLCPTCGSATWGRAKRRKGGRAYLKPPRFSGGPAHSLRVYWPPRLDWGRNSYPCPNPYHGTKRY